MVLFNQFEMFFRHERYKEGEKVLDSEGSTRRSLLIGAGAAGLLTAAGIGLRVRRILDQRDNYAEKKKFKYTLSGFGFASDTISESELQVELERACQLVGGPYWKPDRVFSVERLEKPLVLQQGEILGQCNFWDYKVVATSERLCHELIHLLIGPKQDEWPAILQEFFGYTDAPPYKIAYDLTATDHPAISMAHSSLLYQSTPLHDVRFETLHRLSVSICDQERRALCLAALEYGGMTHNELAPFMASFGLGHAIFEPGKLGECRYAFKGLRRRDLAPIIVMASYAALQNTLGAAYEEPRSYRTEIEFLDDGGKLFPVRLGLHGDPDGTTVFSIPKLIADLRKDFRDAKPAFIVIPEWGQRLDIRWVSNMLG